ncbi:MAG: ATP-binding cassette domain-containing protein [Peptoniphilaceae bacterium]|nr:ATP-binding cassette domain-containing protein [Peptoniphilaceae bacterium]MDY6019461.1 ATP-binding cassette domain-containing protein [Anaerococcus sp.]
MIEVRNLCKKYDDDIIFDNLSFKVNEGEFLVISGPSGSGKTTLLNILGTIEKFDSGDVRILNKDIRNKKNRSFLLQNVIGFLFQNFALVDDKTVEENLKLVKKNVRSQISIEKALDMVNLSNKLKTKIYKLSGGEAQRVAIARLLVKKCQLILCDEPTGSLDRKNADEIVDIIKKLNYEAKTIVMVTHDEKYKNIGDRLIEL